MYACPNCGGGLKFDIESQFLKCDYCQDKFDPYKVEKEQDAVEHNDFEATIYTCPQCGGEVYSTDNAAASFCSFCGSSTVLTSRLTREKRPEFIIPFKKTKEQCKKAYQRAMNMAIFAPKELKNAKYIDGFRGIYMPYWIYYVKQKGSMNIPAERSHRSGDYIITEHYRIHGNIDNYYKGISYDASSSFSDNISSKIAPYDVKNMQSFTPSMLSGFYADTADVESAIYRDDAIELSVNQTTKFIKRNPKIATYKLNASVDQLENGYNTHMEEINSAMFPVWFLSYRNKDRIAYATVNGQTGKVVADCPVDMKKYVFGTLLLAVPIFIILNLLLTVTPSMLLVAASFIAAIVLILFGFEMRQIEKKEAYEDDKGMQRAVEKSREARHRQDLEAAEAGIHLDPYVQTHVNDADKIKRARKKKKGLQSIESIVIGAIVVIIIGAQVLPDLIFLLDSRFVILIPTVIAIGAGIFSIGKVKKTKAKNGAIWGMIAAGIACVIHLLNPASDLFFYGTVILVMIGIIMNLVCLISNYNILATRRLPQFDHRGGDDRA